MVQTVL